MTLIACFNNNLADNIAACLRYRPDKLILLGDETEMQKPMERYRKILQGRNLWTYVEPCNIQGKDMNGICATLSRIVRSEKNCVFDLTGGDALVVMAVGAMLTSLDSKERKNVSVQVYDADRGAAVGCDGDRRVFPGNKAELTVSEVIMLYGGIVYPSSDQPAANLTPADLAPLWSIVSADPRNWNQAVSSLCEFESRSPSKTEIRLYLPHLRNSIHDYETKEADVLDLLEKFEARGIIHNHSSRDVLHYSYTSPLLQYCTRKAGNVLEVKALLEARALADGRTPFFRDCQTSVNIDWDGVVHPAAKKAFETRNEVDLILTRGTTPLFVSCKNGDVDEQELYKLHAVASHFGGPQVKKMLIVTDLEMKKISTELSFTQRAQDMGICLVENAAKLSDEGWAEAFRRAMK